MICQICLTFPLYGIHKLHGMFMYSELNERSSSSTFRIDRCSLGDNYMASLCTRLNITNVFIRSYANIM